MRREVLRLRICGCGFKVAIGIRAFTQCDDIYIFHVRVQFTRRDVSYLRCLRVQFQIIHWHTCIRALHSVVANEWVAVTWHLPIFGYYLLRLDLRICFPLVLVGDETGRGRRACTGLGARRGVHVCAASVAARGGV